MLFESEQQELSSSSQRSEFLPHQQALKLPGRAVLQEMDLLFDFDIGELSSQDDLLEIATNRFDFGKLRHLAHHALCCPYDARK